MDTFESKYRFTDIVDGFTITAKDRNPTYVGYEKYGFIVDNYDNRSHYSSPTIGFFEYTKLLKSIADCIMKNWQQPEDKKPNWKIYKWAKNKTVLALSKRVHERWKNWISKTDPRIIQAQRSYFAASGGYCHLLNCKALYKPENKFVLDDICNYRAAALAVNDMKVDNDTFSGWYSEGNYMVEGFDIFECGPTFCVDHWMKVFSAGAEPPAVLRKQLMNLPGGIPYTLLKCLSYKPLTQPYFTRKQLLAYLYVLRRGRNIDQTVPIVNKSSEKQIVHALKMVYEHLHQPKEVCRKTSKIIQGLQFIFDYPDTHNGSITGLATKSINWHRENRYNQEKAYCTYKPEEKTKLPPIALPKDNRIKFLRTVQDIFDEGTKMCHCVSGYAGRAVEGESFLFNVNYKDELATVELSPHGEILQSRGPQNHDNKATKWASRTLKKWSLENKWLNEQKVNDIPF